MKSDHVSRIEFAVQEAFTNETEVVPAYLLEVMGPSYMYMENVIRKQFLIARYFDIVASVVDDHVMIVTGFTFVPALAVDDVPGEELKARAAELIAAVREEHVDLIANQVSAALARFKASLLEFLREQDAVQQEWMKAHYYDFVATVLAAARGNGSTGSG